MMGLFVGWWAPYSFVGRWAHSSLHSQSHAQCLLGSPCPVMFIKWTQWSTTVSGDPWAPDIEMSKTWTLPWRSSESDKYSNDWSPILQEGFPAGSVGKESACNAGDPGSIPGLGRSPGEGIGYPLQYSGLENSMDSPWGLTESDTTEVT